MFITVKNLFVAAIITLTVSISSPFAREEKLSRSEQTAIELFIHIFTSKVGVIETCSIDNMWLKRNIYGSTIRKYTRMDIIGNVSPSDDRTNFGEIIGSIPNMKDKICSIEEFYSLRDAKIIENKRDSPHKMGTRMIVSVFSGDRTSYSYPIFDKKYRTAFIVINSETQTWRKTLEDKLIGTIHGGTGVYIFRKIKGKWKMIGYDLYSAYS